MIPPSPNLQTKLFFKATWGVLKARDSSGAMSVKLMARGGVFLSEIVGEYYYGTVRALPPRIVRGVQEMQLESNDLKPLSVNMNDCGAFSSPAGNLYIFFKETS